MDTITRRRYAILDAVARLLFGRSLADLDIGLDDLRRRAGLMPLCERCEVEAQTSDAEGSDLCAACQNYAELESGGTPQGPCVHHGDEDDPTAKDDGPGLPKVWIVTAPSGVVAVKGSEPEAEDATAELLSDTAVDLEEGDMDIEEWCIGDRIAPEEGPDQVW